MKQSRRKKISYVLAVLVINFTMNASTVFAEEKTGGGSSPGYKTENKNGSGSEVNAAPSANSSFAANNSAGVDVSVNPSTGQLDLTIDNIKLPGMSEDVNVELGLTRNDKKNTLNPGLGLFGLPEGWGWSLDYILIGNPDIVLYSSGGTNLILDPDTKWENSGLRYVASKEMKMEPPGKPGSNKIEHTLTLKTKGLIETFDGDGKLVKITDRFNNTVNFEYETITSGIAANVMNARLTKITDSFGHEIHIRRDSTNGWYNWKEVVTMPDDRTASYEFGVMDGQNPTVRMTDITGKIVEIKEYPSPSGNIVRVTYPAMGYAEYTYCGSDSPSHGIPYYYDDTPSITEYFPVVIRSKMSPDNKNSSYSAAMETEYQYRDFGSNGSNVYTGYPRYPFGCDSMMNNPVICEKFIYSTMTTQTGKTQEKNIYTTQDFNALHLPVFSTIMQNGETKLENSIHYLGEQQTDDPFAVPQGFKSPLPANYSSTSLVGTRYGGEKGRVTQIKTNYDEYGQPIQVDEYDGVNTAGKPNQIKQTKTLYYEEGDKGDDAGYCQVRHQTETDFRTEETTELHNDLSENRKYIAKSTVEKNLKALAMHSDMRTTETGADSKGRITSSSLSNEVGPTDKKSITTTSYDYDSSKGYLAITTTDPLGNKTYKTVDTKNGFVMSETDANRHSVTYDYLKDKNGFIGAIVKKTYPDGSWELTDESDPCMVVESASNGYVKTTYLDGLGREVKITDNLGENPKERTLETAKYDEFGNVSEKTDIYMHVTKYEYDYQGRVTKETDYLGNEAVYVYDDVKKTVAESVNGVPVSINELDDNEQPVKSVSVASGKKEGNSTPGEINLYDGSGKPVCSDLKLCDGTIDGLARGRLVSSKTMKYDVAENVVSGTMDTGDGAKLSGIADIDLFGGVKSSVTEYEKVSPGIDKTGIVKSEIKGYDKLGQMISLTNQNNQTATCTYDPNGNLKTVTDFSKNTFTYDYDKMNRVRSVSGKKTSLCCDYYPNEGKMRDGQIMKRTLKEGEKIKDIIEYVYDAKGRLSEMKNGGNSMSYIYDGYDRVIKKTDYAGSTTTITYCDDKFKGVSHDAVDSVTDGSGNSITYKYYTKDPESGGGGPLYGSGDIMKSANYYPNGMRVEYEYTSENKKEPALKKVSTYSSANSPLLSSTEYSYDERDRIISITQTSADSSDVNENNIKKYTYNDLGMMLSEEVYDLKMNMLVNTNYTYDIRGNVVTKEMSDGKTTHTTKYIYNDINQLKFMTQDGVLKHQYVYDDNGNLRAECSPQWVIEKKYDYNELNQLTLYYNMSEGVHSGYEYGADMFRKSKQVGSGSPITFYKDENGDICNESIYERTKEGTQEKFVTYLSKALRKYDGGQEWLVSDKKDVKGTANEDGKAMKDHYIFDAYGASINYRNPLGR